MQQASFDEYASRYDEHFTFSHIGKLQRRMVYKNLLPLLHPNNVMLELNCGTGHDAFALISHVKSILATDISPAMIAECHAKSQKKIEGLKFETIGIQEINKKIENYNFVFSNFGGLNCLSKSEFKAFAENCRRFSMPGTELFFVILGRKCIWEKLYFLLKFNYSNAFRRKGQDGVSTHLNDRRFNIWYYSPKEIKRFFESQFEVRSQGPVGLFVPPSYLDTFFKNKNILLKLLGSLDNFFCKFKMLANYGDHFYIHLKKIN